jgi:hypothetical protein
MVFRQINLPVFPFVHLPAFYESPRAHGVTVSTASHAYAELASAIVST